MDLQTPYRICCNSFFLDVLYDLAQVFFGVRAFHEMSFDEDMLVFLVFPGFFVNYWFKLVN